jgi:hypothetical protein
MPPPAKYSSGKKTVSTIHGAGPKQSKTTKRSSWPTFKTSLASATHQPLKSILTHQGLWPSATTCSKVRVTLSQEKIDKEMHVRRSTNTMSKLYNSFSHRAFEAEGDAFPWNKN